MTAVFKRILAWVGNLKGRVIASFAIEAIISVAACMPIFVAAWVLGRLIDASRGRRPWTRASPGWRWEPSPPA